MAEGVKTRDGKPSREERLAAQLRANLQRRKRQARARASAPPELADEFVPLPEAREGEPSGQQ